MNDLYEKPFLVNTEGPDDIEEFDTMREAVERANQINAGLVETVRRGGEHAPHLWAVPWRTSTFLARYREAEAHIGAIADIVEAAVPEDIPGWRFRYSERIASALILAGVISDGRDER